MKRSCHLLAGAAFAVAASLSHSDESSSPRNLPSLIIRWTWKGQGPWYPAILGDGILYVADEGRIVALNAGDGRIIWDRSFCAAPENEQGPVFLGNTVAVWFEKYLYVLDAKTGETRSKLELDKWSARLAGPPLVALFTQEHSGEPTLVSIDDESGKIITKRTLVRAHQMMAGHMPMEVDKGVVIVPFHAGDSDALAGLDGYTLEEIWRIPLPGNFRQFQRYEDQLRITLFPQAQTEQETYLPLDTLTGALGPPLPPLSQSNEWGGRTYEMEEEFASSNRGSTVRVRRNSSMTGKTLWIADLPGSPSAEIRDGHLLYMNCDPPSGRGTLAVVDWETGKVKHTARGLLGIRQLWLFEDLLIALHDDGFAAFSAREFGQPDAFTKSVRVEVMEILARLTDERMNRKGSEDAGGAIRGSVVDLKQLGPEANEVLSQEVTQLGAWAAVAAVRVLGDHEYRSAADPILARLLRGFAYPKDSGVEPELEMLMALGRIGREGQIATIERILADTRYGGDVRRQALATIASIGGPAAERAFDRAMSARPSPSYHWWHPPDASQILDLIGSADLEELRTGSYRPEWETAANSVRLSTNEGHTLVLFPSSYLGCDNDLWLQEFTASGKAIGEAKFLGVQVPLSWADGKPQFEAQPRGAEVTITITDTATCGAASQFPSPVNVDLSAVMRDSDVDGIRDLAEKRLHTNPVSADTDGDGIPDSDDLVPNAPRDALTCDGSCIESDIFRQLFMFEDRQPRQPPAFVVTDRPQKWIGRANPTLSISTTEMDSMLQVLGTVRCPLIRVEQTTLEAFDPKLEPGTVVICLGDCYEPNESRGRVRKEAQPGELVYRVSTSWDGKAARGYLLIVKRLGHRWAIRDIADAGWESAQKP